MTDLNDPKLSVGHEISVDNRVIDATSSLMSGLSPVYADRLGRLWRHTFTQKTTLICFFDPRQLAHAMDAGPSGGDLPADRE